MRKQTNMAIQSNWGIYARIQSNNCLFDIPDPQIDWWSIIIKLQTLNKAQVSKQVPRYRLHLTDSSGQIYGEYAMSDIVRETIDESQEIEHLIKLLEQSDL